MQRRNLDIDPAVFHAPIVITGLAPHPRRAGRLEVELNQDAIGVIAIDLAADTGIRPGAQLDPERLDELLEGVRRTALLDRGLDILAVRAKSSRDLRTRLQRAGGGEVDVDWVIERLTAQGFLNDAAFAYSVARARMVGGGISRRRVESELRRRGIAAETAAEAIDDTVADVGFDEYEAAKTAGRKRIRALASLDTETRRRRLYGWLARRGYEPDVIRRVVRELTGEAGADD